MSDDIVKTSRPFGPSLANAKMPNELVKKLNDYIDDVIKDEEKSKKQDWGNNLVGHVKQEFRLENDFTQSSGFMDFLAQSVAKWIKISENKQIKNFKIIDTWVVRQFKNDYNPIHWHNGHISGVGYLKLPKTFGKLTQDKKNINKNGMIEFIHGNKIFLQRSTFSVFPEVGQFYFFPNYMMHTVYPFTDCDEERRSISFNAKIDDNIYDVYSAK